MEATTSGIEPAGTIVSEAFADLVGSALLVAVTVAVVLTVTAGAWKTPLLLIVPTEADQVTVVLDVFVTTETNCIVPDEVTVVTAGATCNPTVPEVATEIWNDCSA